MALLLHVSFCVSYFPGVILPKAQRWGCLAPSLEASALQRREARSARAGAGAGAGEAAVAVAASASGARMMPGMEPWKGVKGFGFLPGSILGGGERRQLTQVFFLLLGEASQEFGGKGE